MVKAKSPKTIKRQSARYEGLMPLSMSLKGVVGEAVPKKMMAVGRLLSDWEKIMEGLPTQRCVPLKLIPARERHKKKLYLGVASGDVMEVEYSKRQTLDRLQTYFGENFIVDLTLKQMDLKPKRNFYQGRPELVEDSFNLEQNALTLTQQLESFERTLKDRRKNNKG